MLTKNQLKKVNQQKKKLRRHISVLLEQLSFQSLFYSSIRANMRITTFSN